MVKHSTEETGQTGVHCYLSCVTSGIKCRKEWRRYTSVERTANDPGEALDRTRDAGHSRRLREQNGVKNRSITRRNTWMKDWVREDRGREKNWLDPTLIMSRLSLRSDAATDTSMIANRHTNFHSGLIWVVVSTGTPPGPRHDAE